MRKPDAFCLPIGHAGASSYSRIDINAGSYDAERCLVGARSAGWRRDLPNTAWMDKRRKERPS
jgi:hypothetical protein